MKLRLFFLFLISISATAQTPQSYYGTPFNGTTPPTTADCFAAGKDKTSLAETQVIALCCGRNTLAPVSCYEAGRDQTDLAADQVVSMCACAKSNAPVNCFVKAHDVSNLDNDAAVNLCKNDGNYPMPTVVVPQGGTLPYPVVPYSR